MANYKDKKNAGKKKYGNKGGQNTSKDPRDMKDDRNNRDKKYSEGDYTVGASTTNDPSWYMKLNTLVNDAVKISFGNQLGRRYIFDEEGYSPSTIGVLHMIPLPGVAKTNSDGINLAAQGMFTAIRRDISTVASYSAADVMCNFYGIEQVYVLICYILRCFGLANVFSGVNLTMPQRLIQYTMGWNETQFTEFIANLNNYRARFNHLVYKASALYLPTDFTIMDRHAWLFSNYYVDHPTTKAQVYIHTCDYVYELTETKFDTGTALMPVPVYGQTMEQLLGRLNTMIEKFRQSDSMLKITADARRAFADRQSWRLAYCDEGYMVLPRFDQNVLTQIENTTVTPKLDLNEPEVTAPTAKIDAWNYNCVSQLIEENILTCIPCWYLQDSYMTDRDRSFFTGHPNRIINMHWDNPEVKDLVEATVDTVFGEVDQEVGSDFGVLTSANCDICDGFYVYDSDVLDEYPTEYHYVCTTFPERWIQMDWAPMYRRWFSDDQSETINVELDNFAIVDAATMDNIHRATSLSTWSVPQLGMFDK